MKKSIWKCLIFGIIYLIPMISVGAETAKFGIGDWAPFTSEKDKNSQFTETLVRRAFELKGIKVVYEYNPWKKSFEYAKSGLLDGTFPWTKTEERDKEFYYSNEIIFKDQPVFFHPKSVDFRWKSLEDLKNYKVGVILGYKHQKIYKKAKIRAITFYNEEKLFESMANGRVDVFESLKYVGQYIINNSLTEEEANRITSSPKPGAIDEYYMLFARTKRGEKLRKIFDEGLKELRETGEFEKIEKKFFN